MIGLVYSFNGISAYGVSYRRTAEILINPVVGGV